MSQANAIEKYLDRHVYVNYDKNFLAPSVPSNPLIVDVMLRLALVSRKDVVYDVGCRDGRIPIRAVQKPFYAKSAVGIELDRSWAEVAFKKAKKFKRVKIINRDVFECDLRPASVVTLYLGPDSNENIRKKLEYELNPTARIISNSYMMESWRPLKILEMKAPLGDSKNNFSSQTIYLYKMDRI